MDKLLEHANLENLTGLWQLMGATQVTEGLQQSISWPRRCWQHPDQQAAEWSEIIEHIPANYLFPVWRAGEASVALEQALRRQGLEIGLEQLAMVLPLDTEMPSPDHPRLDVRLIESHEQAEQWSSLCGRAFGYSLDAEVIDQLRQQPDVDVLWASLNGEPIATAILYRTGPVTGIHQVGVPPELQGQGIARELMLMLLKRARSAGAEYVCLQASAAGEPLYHKLGFQPQFRIRSYRRG